MAERDGQRDVSSYRPPATRRRDVTTICRLRGSDDVTAEQAHQQRNVAATLLRVQHEPTLVVLVAPCITHA